MAIDLVSRVPGAIAFVNASQVSKGLKVVKIDGRLPGDLTRYGVLTKYDPQRFLRLLTTNGRAGWLAELGTNLVIEFVTKDDPMVKALLRNKLDNYADYEPELFERWLAEAFDVFHRTELEMGTRRLYYAAARSRNEA